MLSYNIYNYIIICNYLYIYIYISYIYMYRYTHIDTYRYVRVFHPDRVLTHNVEKQFFLPLAWGCGCIDVWAQVLWYPFVRKWALEHIWTSQSSGQTHFQDLVLRPYWLLGWQELQMRLALNGAKECLCGHSDADNTGQECTGPDAKAWSVRSMICPATFAGWHRLLKSQYFGRSDMI